MRLRYTEKFFWRSVIRQFSWYSIGLIEKYENLFVSEVLFFWIGVLTPLKLQ